MPRSTVGDIIRRFENEDRIESIPQRGQPKELSDREERVIIRKVKNNPKLSAPKLATEVLNECGKKVCPETIRRVIRRSGYNGRIARKKPYISEVNRKKRLQFAKEHVDKDESWWEDVIFADETKINLFGSDGRVSVWRKPNEELKPSNLQPTVKHGGGSIMIWGCISAAGVGEMARIEGTMKKEDYLILLKEHLHRSAEKLGVRDRFKFYQDNDPKHKSHLVRSWLLYNCPKVIDTPPQSPDLNPIENLWAELKNRVRNPPVKSKKELERRVTEEWYKIGHEYTKKIISNMPKRLREVIKQKGYATNY